MAYVEDFHEVIGRVHGSEKGHIGVNKTVIEVIPHLCQSMCCLLVVVS